MPTVNVKPEISEKNAYYIPRHRYYELKHFVMQYRDWIKRNKTVKEVFETMDTDQRTVVYYLIGKAIEELKKRRVIPMESDAQFTQGLLWNVGSKLNERGF